MGESLIQPLKNGFVKKAIYKCLVNWDLNLSVGVENFSDSNTVLKYYLEAALDFLSFVQTPTF